MGSMITLGIGRMEIDWGKNNSFTDHSSLFKLSDIKPIPYYYVDFDTDEPLVEMKNGCARKLSSVKKRLDLLGYDIESIRGMFEDTIRQHEKYGYKIKLSFDVFYDVLRVIDVSEMDTVQFSVEFEQNGYDFGEYARRCVLEAPQIKDKILVEYEGDGDIEYRNPQFEVSEFLENLDPYITLRILAENPNNADQEVRWSFADVVENGWVQMDEVVQVLDSKKRILIVTEGSSDSFVLRKSIDQLYPDISDFFDFVDMNENYPFTGTGNLYNFCMGLCRISIQNNIIVIFDNDTAGLEKYHQSLSIPKPDSLVITKLPDYPEFSSVCTIGPQGSSTEDINGRAVAIECFLDFDSVQKPPCIRWTTYNKNEKQYQGELECKDEYVRAFKRCNLTDGSYDASKLKYLVNYIISEWIQRDTPNCH
ncbi:hypothetical protein EDD66_103129 [Mobilisporobacter senegalensis]|uniref:HEPN/Toprim N-terminal domain-containing protein n=1 Tax=Mobilisporobacter senegalensis TaxID=1329262 RepID=A0A3N1XR98_9FIRM|nr:HEPN/Toprim-associated domain-containing protein [Mobilisporobacter senegalensis]ROR29194.1 hypothetical protein EDD66_103129 [Mobilisporobacter senegalensis]